ncbi:MAG: RNA polymerase sigma factor, partial [Bacteroidales bacterium]|nr:RNA polymerase sigma factor [Bacteroidales bacterium]
GTANLDAEDIVQDVALNIFTRVDFNSPVENVAGYIYRALRNKIIDIQRKKELPVDSMDKEEETKEGRIIKQIPDTEEEVPEIARNEAMQKKMMQAIEKLKPEQQEVIIATDFEGYTFEELSEETGVPIGTLLSRKHRAMAKLYNMLTDKTINN